MRLLIISHTPHYRKGDTAVGWGSTVREIDQLATLFAEVVHLAPLHPGAPPKSALPYQAPNIRLVPVTPAGGEGLAEKIGALRQVPGWLSAMKAEMRMADALHIRCPAGISIVALLGARLWARGKPTWVKYAGNWGDYPGQAPSYCWQRRYLKKNRHHGVVSINGQWPDQPPHIITLYNPSFTEKDSHQASQKTTNKQITLPVQLLFVGRLSKAKGVDRVLQIAEKLRQANLSFKLTLVGDGPQRDKFEEDVSKSGLTSFVHFAGWQPMTDLARYYQRAHFLLLPSTSEGWPKVLSEAMSFGVVPLASAIASIPQILGETRAGLALPPSDIQAYANAIFQYTQDATGWKSMSISGINASSRFTYEEYLANIRKLFSQYWGIELNHG